MKRPGKRLTTSLDLSTNIPNKKEKSRFAINEITNQDFTKLIIFFNSSPYLCYKSKKCLQWTTWGLIPPNKTDYYANEKWGRVWFNSIKSFVNKKLDKSTKQLDTSMKQYNLRNWRVTTKWIDVRININKLRVRMILRSKKDIDHIWKQGTMW